MQKGNVCVFCGSVQFELSHGLFFCSECGTQSQNAREEITEEDDGFYRTIKQVKTNPQSSESGTQSMSQLEKWQLILQAQCDALCKLGFDPTFKGAVRMIWFLYLRHYHYAFMEPGSHAPSKSRSVRKRTNTVGTVRVSHKPAPKYPFMEKIESECKRQRQSEKYHKQRGKDSDVVSASNVQGVPGVYVYPADKHLFESSASDSEAEDSDPVSSNVSGMDLYLSNWQVDSHGMACFSLKHTVRKSVYVFSGPDEADRGVNEGYRFYRWTRQNKLPYNNVVSFLPSTSRAACKYRSANVWVPLPAERIYNMAASLYMSLPLPMVPPANAFYVCHILVDRLLLPDCFHGVVDKALSCLEWPKFEDSFTSHTGVFTLQKRHFDGDCMALIVMLLRLFYKLDDEFEFKQARLADAEMKCTTPCGCQNNSASVFSSKHSSVSVALQSPHQESSPSKFIYVWEDWVVHFCRHHRLLETLFDERGIDFVKDYQEYLEFVEKEIFCSTRPFSTRCSYNPRFYAEVASIFKSVHGDCEHQVPLNVFGQFANLLHVNSQFEPRVIPFEAIQADPEAPWNHWSKYEVLRRPSNIKTLHFDCVELSKSLLFLLKVCANLVDIQLTELYHLVQCVEQTVSAQNIVNIVL